MNNTISKIFELLTKFNETLFKQLSLRENYDYYNFNKTYFLEAYKIYYTQIDKLFQNYKNNISSLKNSYIFHNSINNILRNLQEKKREFFKKIINEFSKNYDFQLLNISYDLGEMTRIFMEKEYYDYEFTYVYDNVELFENYTTFYISIIISYINNLENETKDYFNYIYNEFYYIFNKYAYDYINTESIKEIEFNKTFCSNYSYKLIEDKFEKNKIRIHDYKQFIEFINMTFIECANKDYNFSLNEKIEYISNITNNCPGNLTFLENDSYIKEIIIILDCYNNNFYNSNLIYFDNFESIYINELNSIISEMEIYLKNNYLDEYFFYNYLNKDFQLEPYENITILDISYNLDGIEGMINYINYLKNENYKNYFSNLLIESFMLSYNNLLNNFISNELIINITILVNNRLELYIEYIEQKLLDEYYYYLLILDDTEEFGNSTKNAFINLYEKINNRINETIYCTIEEYIDFYLNIFLNNYKKILRNNFIDYYTNNLNKYNLTIFRSNELCQEIILENNFNKTIDSISIDLINNIIIKNIKNEIDEISKIQVQKIFNLTQILKLEINEILNDKTIKELPNDMNFLNQLISNYATLLKSHNNKYLFKVSDNPFIQIYDFINITLEPPLTLIKDKYNEIEELLLATIYNITQNFPDYYSIIKEKLQLESIYENLTGFYDILFPIFKEYEEILGTNFNSYINKLIHYTYINGLHTYDKPCNYSFCLFNMDKNNNTRRNEEINETNKSYKYIDIKINKTKINELRNKKIRKLNEYDYTMGSINEEDIIYYLLDINETLYSFINTYLGSDYENINKISNIFLYKVNNTFLNILKRSINMVAIKFSTILVKEKYKNLENNLYKSFYEISSYINNNSELIDISIININDILNISSNILYFSYNLSFYKVKGYYQILCDSIQNQIKYLSEEDIKRFNSRRLQKKDKDKEDDEEDLPEFPNDIKELSESVIFYSYFYVQHTIIINSFQRIESYFNKYQEIYLLEYTEIYQEIYYEKYEKILFRKDKKGRIWESVFTEDNFEVEVSSRIMMDKNQMQIPFSFCIDLFKLNFTNFFVFPYKLFTGLEAVFSIIPSLNIGACLTIGFDINWNKKEYTFYIDISGKAEVSVTFELGLYVPSHKSMVSISVNIGLHGIIGSGAVGVKLSLYLNQDKFIVDTYFKIKAFEFSFYILFKISINLGSKFLKIFKLGNISYEFMIYSHTFLTLIDYEYHIIRGYTYSRKELDEVCKNEGNFKMQYDFYFEKKNKADKHGGKCNKNN